uniref:Protein kinase C gamma type n=1 Tax=Anthurium amnicola TaxID=1678845 RepID=A0A1D1ZE66_9ARAE
MTKGTLKVTVGEAHNLRDTDGILNKGDPYVKLILDKNNTQTTKVIKGDLNPKFNETFSFNIDGQKHLEVEVWDEDPLRDDWIGKAEVHLSKVFSEGHVKETIKLKHKLVLNAGDLVLELDFTSA